VDVAPTVHECKRLDQLSENHLALVLGHSLLVHLLDHMVQGHAVAQFGHQVHMGPLVNYFVKTHNAWVV
jgi:hypothetical protein